MPDKPQRFIVISSSVLDEHGHDYGPDQDAAREALTGGETLVRAIASRDIITTEYRQREAPKKGAVEQPSEPTTESEP